MANEFVTLNPYDDQLEKLRQRQKMADLLQQQALQPLESQVAPGGYAVRTSPVLGLAKMLQAYMGGREQNRINTELSNIRAQMAKPKTLEVGAIDPSKFTPASIREAQATGDYSRLQPIVATKEATPTNLSKLIAEREALPANSPLRKTYDEAIANEGKPSAGVTVYSGSPVAGVDEQGNPVFFQTNKAGGAPSIIPGVRPKPEAMGAAESNAATFADRMANSIQTLNTLPPVPISQEATGAIPLVGNTLINARSRQFKQAERDFITAVLRKESGAVINASEYNDEVKKYIPMAGDDPQTLEMKRKARETALAGMRRAAGPSYKPAPVSVGAPVSGGSNADIFSQADAILGR